MREVIVIGAGVSGLSTAIRLLEAGFPVRVLTREMPLDTVSAVAAALWHPFRAYPERLVAGWALETYAALTRLAGQPGTGVVMRRGLELFWRTSLEPAWAGSVPGFRHATPEELPPGYADGYALEVPILEMPVYLAWLTRRLEALGGRIEMRNVGSLEEVFREAPAVVNCSGLGARTLVGDTSMVPIRGQVIRVAQPGLETFFLDETGPHGLTYIIPRSTDCVLGGTAEEGAEGLEPDPATAAAILERCIALEPRLRDAAILSHRVGVRPGRPAVRLEREPRAAGRVVVHNYGHGGAGVTLSWGCAAAVVELLRGPPSP